MTKNEILIFMILLGILTLICLGSAIFCTIKSIDDFNSIFLRAAFDFSLLALPTGFLALILLSEFLEV